MRQDNLNGCPKRSTMLLESMQIMLIICVGQLPASPSAANQNRYAAVYWRWLPTLLRPVGRTDRLYKAASARLPIDKQSFCASFKVSIRKLPIVELAAASVTRTL